MLQAFFSRAGFACVIVLALAACSAPKEQAFSPEATPVSDAIPVSHHERPMLRFWLPAAKPKAVIVAVHGFNDYSNAFTLPATYFMSKNIAVIAHDQRGFGNTKETGIWPGEENLVYDLRRTVELARKTYPRTPIYILGESMGGAVAITALSRPDFPKVEGLVLAAPAVWGADTMNPVYRSMLWLFAHIAPGETIQSTGDRFKVLASDNIDMLRAMGRDPLVIKHTRIDAIYGLLRLMDSAYSRADTLNVPVLVLYGARDQVIPPFPVKEMLLKLKAPHAFSYYAEGYHMLLRDRQSERVMADIVAWIGNKNAPLPSGCDQKWKEWQASHQVAQKEKTGDAPSSVRMVKR